MLSESTQARSVNFPAVLRAAMILVIAFGVADMASGQNLLVGYAANLTVRDSIVNLTNAGSVNGNDPAGDICANLYIFDPTQELVSCCACLLTPNHLQRISVSNSFINKLTPGPLLTSISIVVTGSSGASGTCNASTATTLVNGLEAWEVTSHVLGAGYAATETKLQSASASASEITKLTSTCSFIQNDGSTYGICKSCAVGAL